MKRLVLLIPFLCLSFFMFGQTDIKSLEGKTTKQIIKVMGNPTEQDSNQTESNLDILTYSNSRIGYNTKSKKIEFFETTSNKYSVLSGDVSGGIRVGMSLSNLKKTKYAKSVYGRNKSKNELRKLSNDEQPYDILGYDSNYVIYSDEYHTIYLYINNDKVVGWLYHTRLNVPYRPYDFSIKIW